MEQQQEQEQNGSEKKVGITSWIQNKRSGKKTLYTRREREEKMNKQQYVLWSEKRDEQKNAHSTFPAVKCKQQCFGVTVFFSPCTRAFLPPSHPSLVPVLKRSHSLSLSLCPLSFAILCALNFVRMKCAMEKRKSVHCVCSLFMRFHKANRKRVHCMEIWSLLWRIKLYWLKRVREIYRHVAFCVSMYLPTYVCVFFFFIHSYIHNSTFR